MWNFNPSQGASLERTGRPTPFDVEHEAAKKEVSQNEANAELLSNFRSLQMTASKQLQATQQTVVHAVGGLKYWTCAQEDDKVWFVIIA